MFNDFLSKNVHTLDYDITMYANTSGNASGTATIDADARCGFNLSK